METLSEEVARLLRQCFDRQRQQFREPRLFARFIPVYEVEVGTLVFLRPLERLPQRQRRQLAEVGENLVAAILSGHPFHHLAELLLVIHELFHRGVPPFCAAGLIQRHSVLSPVW